MRRIKLFCLADDLIKKNNLVLSKKRSSGRKSKLSLSEILAIFLEYQSSGYVNFKYFYECLNKRDYPGLPSYNRMVELRSKMVFEFANFLSLVIKEAQSKHSCAIIDSTKIEVCKLKRNHRKTLNGIKNISKT